eukprot:CAMPEP_0183557668 /NCGR_PEP_ID=MMETSP0371-20130417/86162_1 /TAXON_ID=268820 /ORGANISM="Peridinium aciculiferum, Strain PAER-2" /LENGTH=49 /DNA_ID= /DNA_START= /DNA_END= /DNA_ORIENTATION=
MRPSFHLAVMRHWDTTESRTCVEMAALVGMCGDSAKTRNTDTGHEVDVE